MKKRSLKIVISIMIMMMMIVLLSSNVNANDDDYYYIIWAAFDRGTRPEYEDYMIRIPWPKPTDEEPYHYYWCANHNYELSAHMLDSWSSGVINHTITYKDPSAVVLQREAKNQAINEAIQALNDGISSRNKSATITRDDDWNDIVITEEDDDELKKMKKLKQAIYAFANEFTCSNWSICNSIWKWEHLNNPESCGDGEDNYLWQAANAYVEWSQTPFELRIEDSQARINVKSDTGEYQIGPLEISYQDGGIFSDGEHNEISFTKNAVIALSYMNGDESVEITDLKVVDALGNDCGTDEDGNPKIPNGKEVYLRFPYTKDITKIKIDVKLNYIDDESIWAKEKTHKSKVQVWQYTAKNANIDSLVYKTNYIHTCDPLLSGQQEGWTTITCSNCEVQCTYSVTVKGSVPLTMKSQHENTMQNLREFDGGLEWKYVSAFTEIDLPGPEAMEISGYVWEEQRADKNSTYNGALDGRDRMMGKDLKDRIEVRLYEYDSNTGISTLVEFDETSPSTNPTLTDENGYYSFIGVDPTKKYYVVFVYDGIIYTNTYGAGKPEYNTEAWNLSSKGTELISDRNRLNERLVSVGAYPMKYKVQSILFNDRSYLTYLEDQYYNQVFTESEIETYRGLITTQLQRYLSTNKMLGDAQQNYVDAIYQPILDGITDLDEKIIAKRILQFIWDCRMNSYAGYESIQDGRNFEYNELYAYDNNILLENRDGSRYEAEGEENVNGFWAIYGGQLHVNQGLIRREQTDLALSEDVAKVVLSINGVDGTYTYGAIDTKELGVLSSDIQSYTQYIACSDYNYRATTQEGFESLLEELDGKAVYIEENEEYIRKYAPIQVYVTYRIAVTNNSMIPTSVKEIATYFDAKYFSYSDNYLTTEGKSLSGIEVKHGRDEYSLVEGVEQVEFKEKDLTEYESSENPLEIYINTSSQYGDTEVPRLEIAEREIIDQRQMYISFNKDMILESNEGLIFYITYRLGEDSTSYPEYSCTYNNEESSMENRNAAYRILQDELPEGNLEAKLKIGTISEITAFGTYYSKSSDVQETREKYSNMYNYGSYLRAGETYRAAGVLDYNSTPGNLTEDKIWEDDWDYAPELIFQRPEKNRTLKGSVWETVKEGVEDYSADYWQNKATDTDDNYPKYDETYAIKNITVELIELKDINQDGIEEEYVRARTITKGENGEYKITGYIPGKYAVKFTYGDWVKYAENPEENVQVSPHTYFTINETDNINSAYNGLLYQSARANPETNGSRFWYSGKEGIRYSDASDEANRRIKLNETLQNYTYNDLAHTIKDFSENQEKYEGHAYTSMLEICFELATQEKNKGESSNPGYTIENVDCGLTPRTPSKLVLEKKEVKHIKMILGNGMIQMDVDTSTIRTQGVPGVTQADSMNGIANDIYIAMSNELITAATIELTYTITLKNNAENVSTNIYYDENNPDNALAIAMYNEDAKFENDENNNSYEVEDFSKLIYYKGEINELENSTRETRVSESRAVVVADFIPMNLQFIKEDYTGRAVNSYWEQYNSAMTIGISNNDEGETLDGSKDDLKLLYYQQTEEDKAKEPEIINLDEEIKEKYDRNEIYDSNDIIIANSNNPLIATALKPGESVSTDIVLSKTLQVNANSEDKKVYDNKVRILKVHSSDSKIQGMPFAQSEKVTVADPTGITNKYLVIGLIFVVSLIIAGGIVLIKKFIIPKR